MNQLHLTRQLLSPSWLSGLLAVLLAAALIASNAWAYIDSSQLFYEELFGSFGLVTALLYAPDAFAVLDPLWNSPITYGIIIFVCAVVAAILTYNLIESAKRVANETSTVWYQYHVHTPEAQKVVREAVARVVIRCVSLLAWAIYLLLFITILVPFCTLLLETGIDTIAGDMPQGWLAVLAAWAFLTISLHLNVTFLRLGLMRVRIIGTNN